MSGKISGMAGKERMTLGVRVLLMVACAALGLPLAAQQRQGPLPPPPPWHGCSIQRACRSSEAKCLPARDVLSYHQ